jgi:HSP20 family protein
MFDSLSEGFGGKTASWSSPKPALDIAETEKELVVSAELPGVSEKDVEVTLAGNLLTVKGEKKIGHKEKNGDVWYAERRYGSFSHSMRLPFVATDENVEAKFENGVLVVRIPKPAELQKPVRRIEVKSA